jgi:hypothetical protein
MCKPHSADISHASSELCRQAFIDSMKMFNNTLSHKELIRSVLYVRFIIVLLTGTQTIVISEYMEKYRIRQRPQVGGLSTFHFLLAKPNPLL